MHSYIKKRLFVIFTVLCTLFALSPASGEERMRGMWISTVYNLDYPSSPTTDPAQLKAQADKILDNCRDMGINNVFLQVRPASDALYKSSIYPWSAYLTGSQGTAPGEGFDPLQYWIEGAHSRGMELHAWVNPYRATKVSSGDALSSLSADNPASIHPEYIIKYSDGNYYYDPALPEVRQLVIDGIMEIVNNYDVDGIHMDDYFYPGTDFNDETSFQQYKGSFTDKGDWRRNNVNLLVSGIKSAIDSSGKDVEFGISPAGIWANSSNNPLGSNTSGNEAYYSNYADTRKWALEGTVDYIAPQIYWEVGHSAADYATLVNWWSDTLKDAPAKLYIGLADYKANGVTDTTSPWYGGDEIIRQINMNGDISKIGGEIHFRYQMIMDTPGLYDKIRQAYAVQNNSTQTTTVATETTSEASIETTTQATNNSNEIRVIVNGEYVTFDQQPVIEDDRTLVPMRAIFEALGADVQWNDDTRSVIAESTDGTRITLIIDSKNMLRNNTEVIELDVPAKIMGSRTMVPLRAISEALNCNVEWDAENRLVTITELHNLM